MTDRSKDVSTALTEVRTVHSRALAALEKLAGPYAGDAWWDEVWWDGEGGNDGHRAWYDEHHINYVDPDLEEMVAALEQVTQLLAPWQGKRRRR